MAAKVGDVDDIEISSESGTSYGIEINFVWDSRPGGAVRVMGCIDDGGIRAFFPMGDDFVKASDGTFAGEPAE